MKLLFQSIAVWVLFRPFQNSILETVWIWELDRGLPTCCCVFHLPSSVCSWHVSYESNIYNISLCLNFCRQSLSTERAKLLFVRFNLKRKQKNNNKTKKSPPLYLQLLPWGLYKNKLILNSLNLNGSFLQSIQRKGRELEWQPATAIPQRAFSPSILTAMEFLGSDHWVHL